VDVAYNLILWRPAPRRGWTGWLTRRRREAGTAEELTAEEIAAAFLAEFPDLVVEPTELRGPMFSIPLPPRPIRSVLVNCALGAARRRGTVERIVRTGRDRLRCCVYDPQTAELVGQGS
jgi:hypothetical protein